MHDSVAVSESETERARESDADLGQGRFVGFCASPVVAAIATPVRQALSQVDFTKSAKKSAEKIRPDLLQMWGINFLEGPFFSTLTGVPENSPLASIGRFLYLMGRFPPLMGPFPECLKFSSASD